MISIKMEQMLKSNSAIREMFEEGKRLSKIFGKDNVFDFSLGNPSVNPPTSIADTICEIVADTPCMELHGYMNNSGYESTRQAIADFINEEQGTHYDFSNVIMTVGAAGGLNVILKTLLNPQDEVIVFSPYFGEYRNYVNNFDGVLVEVEPNVPTFIPDLEKLTAKLSAKTKAVIINSPNNPTGVVYEKDFFVRLSEVLTNAEQKFGTSIYLISDEPYREIVYDGHQSVFVPRYYHNTIVGYSYSKSLSLPGERIGYLLIPDTCDDFDDIIGACNVANRILGFVNAPSLQQKLVERTLGTYCDLSEYAKNRDILTTQLSKMGFEFVYPQGAFYLFIKSPIADDKEFCKVAKEHHILIVPGSSFGCSGWARLSYCVDSDMIVRSLSAFSAIAKHFGLN